MFLKIKYGKFPYDFFKDKVDYPQSLNYKLEYSDIYYSFSYFNLENAQKYYKSKPSLIHDIMLGIIGYNDMVIGRNVQSEKLLEQAKKIGKRAKYVDGLPHFFIDEDFSKFDLKGKVFSGIVQAKASSFFLRVYKASGEEKYLDWSKGSLLACLRTRNEGGIMLKSSAVKSWVEEYDTEKPSMVLNGFVFVLIAASEYLTLKEDYHIREFLDNGLATLIAWLPNYINKKDILYSMYHWDMSNIHYLGVMKYQFEHLQKITGLEELTPIISLLNNKPNIDIFRKIIA